MAGQGISLQVGAESFQKNTVTWLQGTGLFNTTNAEDMLGFHHGRLRSGYYVLLLKRLLIESDFEFDGNTLRSDGRVGLPADTAAADKLRPRVHDQLMQKYGQKDYVGMQKAALKSVTLKGETRITKIIPKIGNDSDMKPSLQYPMGGGSLQWKLKVPCAFLVALLVDDKGTAHWPTGSAQVGLDSPTNNGMTDNRAIVRRYLQNA